MAPQNVPPPPTGWAVRQSPDRVPPTDFQLSNCQGRKRALFVGINYFGQANELRGCINDVKNIKTFIMRQFGFKEDDTISLTDDQQDPSRIPTHANILAAMHWLVKDARPNDSFFFHYSGHGGQIEDQDGDEDDGFDETIYPMDHEESGVIIDDTMHDILIKTLPAGCRLTAIMDCCHSGSALDLPYIYSTTGNLKEANIMADVGSGVLTAGMAYMKGDMGGMLRGLGGLGKKLMAPKRDKAIEKKASPADCIMFSGYVPLVLWTKERQNHSIPIFFSFFWEWFRAQLPTICKSLMNHIRHHFLSVSDLFFFMGKSLSSTIVARILRPRLILRNKGSG